MEHLLVSAASSDMRLVVTYVGLTKPTSFIDRRIKSNAPQLLRRRFLPMPEALLTGVARL